MRRPQSPLINLGKMKHIYDLDKVFYSMQFRSAFCMPKKNAVNACVYAFAIIIAHADII